MKQKDEIYKNKRQQITPFSFDQNTANVFDNMIRRSIPCYEELQKIISSITLKHYQPHTVIYDLGCSTGNTILQLYQQAQTPLKIKAVDRSTAMIEIAKKKCSEHQDIEWICSSLEEISFNNTSVILASYVLQFIPILKRKKLLKTMFDSLSTQGILILSEKVSSPDPEIEKMITELYYDFKRQNNYSNLEIEQKEEALKNVLFLLSIEEYLEILKNLGFRTIQLIFKYLNFMSLIAIK